MTGSRPLALERAGDLGPDAVGVIGQHDMERLGAGGPRALCHARARRHGRGPRGTFERGLDPRPRIVGAHPRQPAAHGVAARPERDQQLLPIERRRQRRAHLHSAKRRSLGSQHQVQPASRQRIALDHEPRVGQALAEDAGWQRPHDIDRLAAHRGERARRSDREAHAQRVSERACAHGVGDGHQGE